MSDYILCEVCDSKALYDGSWAIRDAAEEYGRDVAALCAGCSKTHYLTAQLRTEPPDAD